MATDDKMLRLFAAVSLPDPVIDRLLLLRRDLSGVRWRERDTFHLTLAFFGELTHEQARDLDELLAEINAAPFEVELEGVGWFGRRDPSAVWAGVASNEPLTRLATACARVGTALGLEPQNRRYRPHVTLGYCHGADIAEIGAYQNALREFRTGSFIVDQFELYSSHRTRGQNRYEEEATYPLWASSDQTVAGANPARQ